jgi:alkanesulfonate monooxygenase SsuD/methylene tetrahydromethanopterin reductase-like flavin-dependent oxidoreductase (luciferase family)
VGGGLRADLRRAVEEAVLAERLGLESFWVTEHHFAPYGVCPDPAVLLAAVAERTRRLRLGTATAVLPLDHPLRIAESYALLDQLSGGRLEFGVGSGYLTYEFAGFGLDPEQRRERFEEALAVVRMAWGGGPIRHSGRHFRIDAPPLNVQPLQPGGPPVHVGVVRPAAAPFVARQGLPVALVPYIAMRSLGDLEETLGSYRAALPAGRPGGVTVALHAYCAATPDDAGLRLAEEALARYLRTRVVPGARYRGEPVAPDFVLFGTAEDLLPRLRALAALGVDRLLLLCSFGGLPAPVAAASLERLARFAPALEA